jgi:hypothetical protein
MEHRLFELTGRWASETGDPEVRVFFGAMSARHADASVRWRGRLPVRAGFDVAALVVAPGPGHGAAVGLLEGQSDHLCRLGGLVEVVLPRLRSAYRDHLAGASPVSEGPVIRVLREIAGPQDRELAQGRALLGPEGPVRPTPDRARRVAEFRLDLERSFEAASDKSPAAWAS